MTGEIPLTLRSFQGDHTVGGFRTKVEGHSSFREECKGSNVCAEEPENTMYPNDKYARFTFNLPAERRYFADDTKGLRIRLERGTVFLQPSTDMDGDDIMSLATRTRGGRSTDLHADATAAKQIMKVFGRNGFTTTKPFFVLQDKGDGWIRLEHFPETSAPPKPIPHLRIWPLTPIKPRRTIPFDMYAWRYCLQDGSRGDGDDC